MGVLLDSSDNIITAASGGYTTGGSDYTWFINKFESDLNSKTYDY
jgi:hypothetical protein